MQAKDIKNVSVVGAGMMGHGIAQIFALQDYRVYLHDVKEEILTRAVDNIRANLSLMADRGLGTSSEIEPAIGRIKTTIDLAEAMGEADFVVECVLENMELKQGVFQELDRLCPADAILATNTSVMSITEIASKAKRRERIIGTHFWNPPYLIPLVEVVKGTDTSDAVVETTYQLLKRLGKHPVKCLKDVPGFIANRLQHALWREAISMVEHGIAAAAAIDEAIKNSIGIRLGVLGPLETADMAGLDLTLAVHDYILKHLEASPGPSPLLREKVERGELGFKSGQGFQTWTPERAEQSRRNLVEYLIDWTKRNQSKG